MPSLVRKIIAQGVMGGQYKPFGYELSPEQLISLYQYGDLIHWGKKRDELAEAADDPVLEGLYRITFMETMLVFAHIYLGFAKVIEAMTKP